MAIQINGDGTITGISAGGLPAGSVTSATLASGAITAATLPAGSVIQTVIGSGTGNQASGGCNALVGTTTDTNDVVDAYMTFTPLKSTSTILIVVSSGCSIAGTYSQLYIKESVSGATVGQTAWGNFGGAQSLEGVSFTGVHKPGNTVQRTYQFIHNMIGSQTRYQSYSSITQMIIMEIAA
tara:strand:+ start:739 stop:1281 length:543 start_codon:yes stop_codon:yes gene_type:complete